MSSGSQTALNIQLGGKGIVCHLLGRRSACPTIAVHLDRHCRATQIERDSNMSWSLPIVRIAGIQLRIHVTFLLLIGWLAFGYYSQGGSAAAIAGILVILLLFACVVLHEFGHAFAAKAFGINTPDITLLPIGGVARLERMPEEPIQELIIA